MDEDHLLAAARYVALNPVKAHLVSRAELWPWSSARAHLEGKDDDVVATAPLLSRIPDFQTFLTTEEDFIASSRLERAASVGRPSTQTPGSEVWNSAQVRPSSRANEALCRRRIQKRNPKPYFVNCHRNRAPRRIGPAPGCNVSGQRAQMVEQVAIVTIGFKLITATVGNETRIKYMDLADSPRIEARLRKDAFEDRLVERLKSKGS